MLVPIIKTAFHALSLLPFSVIHALGKLIGTGLYLFPSKIRHITETNIALCLPDLDTKQQQQLAKNSLIHTGIAIAEVGAMLCWPQEKLFGHVQTVSGKEHIDAKLEQGKGVILLTPHLGCWEIAGLYIGQHYQATTLYKPPKMQGLSNWLKQARQRTGANLVSTADAGPRQLLVTLKRSGVIALLPDQEPSKGNGVFSKFFGVDAYTMTLAVRLANKTGASIIFGFAERLPNTPGYRLHAIPASEDIYNEDTATALASMNKSIEHCISLAPEQYQWGYKRFRKQPEGKSGFYR